MMEKREVAKKTLVEISRILLGVTFIFSGFTKSVDPFGFAYKIQDYLISFGLEYFFFLALPLAITLCVIEFSAGIFMLLGIYRKWTSRMILLIMAFMTPLTLYLAIANPVSDCGCFGDAWVITNWETFFKNIVLLIAAILAFIYHEKIYNLYTGKFYWLVALFIIAYSFTFSIINCYFEPVIDFRPYKIGSNLPKLINVEEGKGDVYQNIFIYEKDGVKKEFSEDNYPWQDSTWIFVDRINKLIKEGEKPIITDFSINELFFNSDKTAIEGSENITSEILENENYTFLMIAYSLPNMRESAISNLEDVKNYAVDHNYKFYCLTASTEDEIINWEDENSIGFKYCLTDERTLKTMTRSNPGLMLLKDGIIVNKWSPSRVPTEEKLTKPLNELSFGQKVDTEARDKKNMTILIIIFVAPLVLIRILDFLIYRNKLPSDLLNKN